MLPEKTAENKAAVSPHERRYGGLTSCKQQIHAAVLVVYVTKELWPAIGRLGERVGPDVNCAPPQR